ncbi:4-(cytidine 5'-diphospho)-2-C-methyl-D-erythritol kinase [Nocardioides limicola]|uniref:4-(cytidine 5'-diphospho)-2-C-methyl-D-erythritol kinase n=1 Tax=Nocardioides limicola TaxID=2803368 RepID=UPI00193C2EBE|nr:4-(cytidine 5'-diphospho)-2-C-methyl-D-erythritol kinase [Nocardioides sp. DJM-14]
MTSITVRAAAKVNLHLGVGAPRPDGYHPLHTVYTTIGLHDDVTATAAAELGVTLTGLGGVDVSDVPVAPGSNLVHAAAAALADLHGVAVTGALHIAKSIPVAGGLAGGSADAAAALVALDRLLDLQTSDDDLLRLAAALGSDVPFALLGGIAVGTGRGEIVQPVPTDVHLAWVVCTDPQGLSTPEVYRHFDRLFPDADPTPPAPDALLAALAAADVTGIAEALHNDLQDAAVDLRPELGARVDHGVAAGALAGLVSGSGPTVVLLCADPEAARAVAAEMAGRSPGVQVAHGPVAGAHVVEYAD